MDDQVKIKHQEAISDYWNVTFSVSVPKSLENQRTGYSDELRNETLFTMRVWRDSQIVVYFGLISKYCNQRFGDLSELY